MKSLLPNWGYKLFKIEGDEFLKNGITSKINPFDRYTKDFMKDKYMKLEPIFENRQKAWDWEFLQNTVDKGPWNKSMH